MRLSTSAPSPAKTGDLLDQAAVRGRLEYDSMKQDTADEKRTGIEQPQQFAEGHQIGDAYVLVGETMMERITADPSALIPEEEWA